MYDPDIFSALTDARAAGYYQPTADYYNQFNRVQQAYENERALNRRLAREEQASLKAYSEQLRNRIQEQEAKPQVSYIDPVSGRNLGVNPFPQSEYTPEQLGLKKVINGAAQEPQGPIDYAPNNSRDMQIISRGRDFERDTPKTPRWTDAYRTNENPAWNKWYADRGQAIPGTIATSQVNPWEGIEGEPKEPHKEQAKIDKIAKTASRPGWSMATATFGPTILAQQIMNLRKSPLLEYLPEHVKERYRKYFSEQLSSDVGTGASNAWETLMKLF